MFLEFGTPFLLLSLEEQMAIDPPLVSSTLSATSAPDTSTAATAPPPLLNPVDNTTPASPARSTRAPSPPKMPLFLPGTPASSPPEVPALPEPSYTTPPGDTEISVSNTSGPAVTALKGRFVVSYSFYFY